MKTPLFLLGLFLFLSLVSAETIVYENYSYAGMDFVLISNTDQCLIDCEAVFLVKNPETLYISDLSTVRLSSVLGLGSLGLETLELSVLQNLTRTEQKTRVETFADIYSCSADILIVHPDLDGNTSGEISCYASGYDDPESKNYQKIYWTFPSGSWKWLEQTADTIIHYRMEETPYVETSYYEAWVPYTSRSGFSGKNLVFKVSGTRRGAQLYTNAVDWKLNFLGAKPDWAWWDSSWSEKQLITLNETVSAGFQVKLTITYDSDMQADFDDLRFTNYAEDTELDYWIESYTASTSAVVWVEMENSDKLYMYYDNSAASTTSSEDDTFLFADLFDRSDSETVGNGWGDAGDMEIYNNELFCHGCGGVQIDRAWTNEDVCIHMDFRHWQTNKAGGLAFWADSSRVYERNQISWDVGGQYLSATPTSGWHSFTTPYVANVSNSVRICYDPTSETDIFCLGSECTGTVLGYNSGTHSDFIEIIGGSSGTAGSYTFDNFFITEYYSYMPSANFGTPSTSTTSTTTTTTTSSTTTTTTSASTTTTIPGATTTTLSSGLSVPDYSDDSDFMDSLEEIATLLGITASAGCGLLLMVLLVRWILGIFGGGKKQ